MKTNIQRPTSNATHRGWLHSTLSILRLRPLRAFTLLEVMLAIAIFSVVMGAMYATWRAIINATRASQYAAAEAQRVRVTLSSLEQSLTYTEKYVASGGLYWCDFKNGPDGYLTFVSNLPESFPRSGRFGGMQLRRVEFFIRRSNEGGNELALRQRAILREEYDKDEQEYPLVLLKNIKSMTTESWDEKKQDWTDEDWGDTNQIPKKVRMTIATENRKNPNDRGEEYIRIIRPASVGVQAGWQGSGGGGAPGTAQPPGTALPAPPVTR